MVMKPKRLLMATLLAISSGASAEDLLDVYRLAEEADPQVKAAEAAWQAVKETRNQRLAQFRPQLSLNSNLTRNRQEFLSGGFFGRSLSGQTLYSTNSGLTLNLNQPLYHRDYYVQLRQTEARTRQAEADYSAAQQALFRAWRSVISTCLPPPITSNSRAPRKRPSASNWNRPSGVSTLAWWRSPMSTRHRPVTIWP